MRSARLGILLLAISICTTIGGCDPVRSTQQSLLVKVLDHSGVPVENCRVGFKRSFVSDAHKDIASSDFQEKRLEAWSREPWNSGVTDEKGLVKINFVTTMIDRSSGDIPSLRSNVLAGKSYQVQLVIDGESSELEFFLENGASISKNGITISVEKISDPRYVETQN